MDPARGAAPPPSSPAPGADDRHRRAGADRHRRVAAVALVALALVTVVTGCVGKRGRNDDPVAPGSDGKARTTLPVPVAADGAHR